MIIDRPSIFPLTVQFEDVDAHGVVHHPNYLKYLERARSYGIRKCGYSLEKLKASGLALAISEIHASYLHPALLEQELLVISRVTAVGKSSIKLEQAITLNLDNYQKNILAKKIFFAKISLVCVDFKSVKVKSLPLELKQIIKIFNQNMEEKLLGIELNNLGFSETGSLNSSRPQYCLS